MVSAAVVFKKAILGFVGVATLAVLVGCSTLPPPRSFHSSLLVLVTAVEPTNARHPVSDRVVIHGPVTIELNLARSKTRIHFFRVKPGRYVLDSRTIRWRGGASRSLGSLEREPITVPPATILMPDWKFAAASIVSAQGSGTEAKLIIPTTAADRRLAAQTLKDFVRLARWAGRRVEGFAPYSPFTDYVAKKFTVRIESTPTGSRTIIDGEDWGTTPLPVSLAPGKHFLRIEHTGFLQHTAFIDVEANGTENFALKPAPAGEGNGKRAVLIEPFVDLSMQPHSSLSALLTKSLRAALQKDGVVVLGGVAARGSVAARGTVAARSSGTPAAPARAGAPPIEPDFAAAEHAGAAAFISGDYTTKGRSLLVHASLYDTETHLVRASVVLAGEAGLGLFDSIDRMSSKLGAEVAKALPKVGQPVVHERVITPQTATFDTRVNEQEVIRRRNEKRFTLAAGPSLVGVFDTIANPSSPGSTVSRIDGPGTGLYGSFGLPLVGPVTLNLATTPFVYTDANHVPRVEIPLYLGARWNFYGYMSDVYLGLQGAAHYAPSTAINFSNGSSTPTVPVIVGPYWLFGLNFETGVRIYTYRRISRPPTFMGLGLTLGLFGYRFDLKFSNPTAYPMEVGLRLYWGTRL